MLRELAKLSGGMLFLGGHVADPETARLLARDDAPPVRTPRRGRRLRHGGARSGYDWRSPVELLGLAAIWGGSFLFLRIATPHFGPAPLVDLRLALGALVLTPFLWRERARFPWSRWPQLAAIGLFGERIGGRRLAGLLGGLVGVAVLASGDLAGASLGPAVAAGALAALFYGVSANVVKRYLADLPPIAVAAATLGSGAVLLAPFAAWTWPSAPI